MPSLFFVHKTVESAERVRIVECKLGGFEANPMLRDIAPVLGFVPFNPHLFQLM